MSLILGLVPVTANGDNELDVMASSMEAYFDFDTENGGDPVAPDGQNRLAISVFDYAAGNADLIPVPARC